MKRALTRFFKYSLVGGSTFALDLTLLFLLIVFLDVHYILSAGVAFGIAVSINYFISRHFVFRGTPRKVSSGYLIFFIIAIAGSGTIMGLMFLFVDVFHLHYLASRICIAALVGICNYLMNLYVNFKMAGQYIE